jgi:hypothetical protein
MNQLDDAVDNFKENTEPTDKEQTALELVNKYIRKFLKDEFKKLHLSFDEKLEDFNTSIDMIINRVTKVEKSQIKVKTQLSTSINIFKFLFGGGCVLTVINIIVAMVK